LVAGIDIVRIPPDEFPSDQLGRFARTAGF